MINQEKRLRVEFYKSMCIFYRTADDYSPKDTRLKTSQFCALQAFCEDFNLSLVDVLDYCAETAYTELIGD